MPQDFPNYQYVKRERKKHTAKSPQLSVLMSEKDRKNWVNVTVPKVTPYFDTEGRPIAHQSIEFNSYPAFEPGQTYLVHPIVAEELKTALFNYEDGVAMQLQKRNRANIPQYNPELVEQVQLG